MSIREENIVFCSRFYADKLKCSESHKKRAYRKHYVYLLMKYLFGGKIEIPFVEAILTTKCTLKCRNCSNLIPEYDKHMHPQISVDEYLHDMDVLLEKVSYIHRFKIHGGEPMLCDRLPEIIDKCCSNAKIGEVRMSTNATIMPNEVLIKSFCHEKFVLFISNYQCSSNNAKKLIEICRKHGIKYRFDDNQTWVKYGDVTKHNKPIEQLIQERKLCCMAKCIAMLNGKIFLCSRQANATQMGLIPNSCGIDIHSSSFKKEMKKLYGDPYNAFCDYCAVELDSVVQAGEQRI